MHLWCIVGSPSSINTLPRALSLSFSYSVCGQPLLSLPICSPTIVIVSIVGWEFRNGLVSLTKMNSMACPTQLLFMFLLALLQIMICGGLHGVGGEIHAVVEAKCETSTPRCWVYVVQRRIMLGLYSSWEERCLQTKGFPGAKFKSFHRLLEARQYIGRGILLEMNHPSTQCVAEGSWQH